MNSDLSRKNKLPAFAFIVVLFFACTEEKKHAPSSEDNTFLMAVNTDVSEKETDETLKDFVPAQKDEIDAVRTTEDTYSIQYGHSSGECIGFCESTIEFTSKGLLNTSFRYSDNKEIIEYQGIEDSVYNQLIASINFKEFINFTGNLGCGDCADCGEEWIEIEKGDQSKKIGGMYGFDVECINSLLNYLRNFGIKSK